MFRFRHPEIHQEEDVLPWGRVIGAFLLSLFIAAVLTVWAWTSGASLSARLRPSGQFPERDLGPRHEVGHIQEALFEDTRPGQRLFEAQHEDLLRWSWVDRDKGIANIPIDVAMDLVVKEAQR